MRPGTPSRSRPTGSPHDGQYRLRSGTWGSAITTCSGSRTGTDGTVVSPAPSRAPRSRVEPVPSVRVAREPLAAVRAEPSAAVASRLELVRPVRVDRSSSPPGPRATGTPDAIPVPSSDVAEAAGRVTPVPAGAVGACGEPQTLQYPSS
ncbi:hypothetical protein GCM10009774_28720 [Cellulomonas gelida]|nr:hypothetical protein GCM10009774_28720 [Cellulomonas gelida]